MKVVISSSENREVLEKINDETNSRKGGPPITRLVIEDHPLYQIVIKVDEWTCFRYTEWDYFLLNWPKSGKAIVEILKTHFPELFL